MCERRMSTQRHHLVPRTMHKRLRKRKRSVDLYARKDDTVDLCNDCHRKVHSTWSEKDLAFSVNTLESIMRDDRIVIWVEWISKR